MATASTTKDSTTTKMNSEEEEEEEGVEEVSKQDEIPQQLNGKKLSWYKLRRFDSLDIESRHCGATNHHGSKVLFLIKINFISFSRPYKYK